MTWSIFDETGHPILETVDSDLFSTFPQWEPKICVCTNLFIIAFVWS